MAIDEESAELTTRQETLLDQLTELFLTEGFRAFTLEGLARRLRCSKSTLYALSHSKEQLAARTVEHFFVRAAVRVEAAVATQRCAAARVQAYLEGVAAELATASGAFLSDVAANPVTRRSYERHTHVAANRVRELIAEGVAAAEFQDVHARFAGEVTAAAMDAIERGGVTVRTGLSHAEAYGQLAALVLRSVSN